MDTLHTKIKTIIIRTLLLSDKTPQDIGDGEQLFGGGLGLDSVDALELAMELEDAFGVKLPDDSTSRAVFRSVDTLAAYITEHAEA